MNKLFKGLVGVATGLALTLGFAVPAAQAAPPKNACYVYTWDVLTYTKTGSGTPGTPDEYRVSGDFSESGVNGLYGGEQGGLNVFNYVSDESGRITGFLPFDAPLSAYVSAPAGVAYTQDSSNGPGAAVPVGVLRVDLDANGTVDTKITFDQRAATLAANPNARIKAVGFTIVGFVQGWVAAVQLGQYNFSFVTYVQGTPGSADTYTWVKTGTGTGASVPAYAYPNRYVQTSKTQVKCPSPGKG